MTEQTLQNDFLQYIRFEKRYSQHTLKAYQQDLEQFQNYISIEFGHIPIVSVTHFHIRSWMAQLKDGNQTPRSINRKMSSLNSFYKYLLKQKIVSKNPIRQLHSMKQQERLPSYLKEIEADNLLEEMQFEDSFKGKTDRLICELLYQTGMRRQELTDLKELDIEWQLKQLRILGKGNKERLIPISDELLVFLRHYINEKNNINTNNNRYLLVLETGEHLYPGYIYRIVKKYLGGVTTLKKKSPHILRHSFATHLLNNGANIQAIKDLLGHSSLAATQVYVHNNIEKLKEVHKLNHPRG